MSHRKNDVEKNGHWGIENLIHIANSLPSSFFDYVFFVFKNSSRQTSEIPRTSARLPAKINIWGRSVNNCEARRLDPFAGFAYKNNNILYIIARIISRIQYLEGQVGLKVRTVPLTAAK